MYKIDYLFVMVGLQLLFNEICSEMSGLPCRGLAASIRGCNMKNCPRKARSGQIKKSHLTNTIAGYAL